MVEVGAGGRDLRRGRPEDGAAEVDGDAGGSAVRVELRTAGGRGGVRVGGWESEVRAGFRQGVDEGDEPGPVRRSLVSVAVAEGRTPPQRGSDPRCSSEKPPSEGIRPRVFEGKLPLGGDQTPGFRAKNPPRRGSDPGFSSKNSPSEGIRPRVLRRGQTTYKCSRNCARAWRNWRSWATRSSALAVISTSLALGISEESSWARASGWM